MTRQGSGLANRSRERSERWAKVGAVAVAIVLACASAARAQATVGTTARVSTSDIQRLQDQVSQAATDISKLRGTNADLASRLQVDLDDLRDEVTYLKVKLRKEG